MGSSVARDHSGRTQVGLPSGSIWRLVGVERLVPCHQQDGVAVATMPEHAKEYAFEATFLAEASALKSRTPSFVTRLVGVGALPAFRLGSTWSAVGGAPLTEASRRVRPGDAMTTVTPRAPNGATSVSLQDWLPVDVFAPDLDDPGMAYWHTGDEDGPLLIPVPELLRAALMPSTAFAERMAGRDRAASGWAKWPIREDGSLMSGRTLELMTERVLDRAEAVAAAALFTFPEAANAFVGFRSALDNDIDPWSIAAWPIPTGTKLDGLVKVRTFRDRSGAERDVRVLARIDACHWPFAFDQVVVKHPRSQHMPADRSGSGADVIGNAVLQPGASAEPGPQAVIVLDTDADAGTLRIWHEAQHWGGGHASATGGASAPKSIGITTGAAASGGTARGAAFRTEDPFHDDPCGRMEITVQALERLAQARVVAPLRWKGEQRNAAILALPRLHGRVRCWAELSGRPRRMLIVELDGHGSRNLLVDCEVEGEEAIALGMVRVSALSDLGSDLYPALARTVVKDRGLLRTGRRVAKRTGQLVTFEVVERIPHRDADDFTSKVERMANALQRCLTGKID